MAQISSDVQIQTLMDQLVDQASKGQVSNEEVNDPKVNTTNIDNDVVMADDTEENLNKFMNNIDSEIKNTMEVDMPSEDKENIRNAMRQLSRTELEELILQKVIEGIN